MKGQKIEKSDIRALVRLLRPEEVWKSCYQKCNSSAIRFPSVS